MSAGGTITEPERCALCLKPATGYAFIGEERYCHGDDDSEPTCYEMASRTDRTWLTTSEFLRSLGGAS